MAAFLLIIMGAVSATIIKTLAETQAAVINASIFYTVSGTYVLAGMLILFITIKFNKLITRKRSFSTQLRIFELLLLLPTLIYCLVNQWHVPAAYAGIGIFGILYAFYYEFSALKDKIVTIDDKGINNPHSKTGFLAWEKVLRLIVRHQILTIEAQGNKLYQYDLQSAQTIDVAGVESFAAQRIKEEKKVIKNDW
ncbi:MAG: hypothetical protein EOP54_16660 [Sphingobacteriales bacterium]|nr:MAG: hypothetical protein EOP54_16660 [Sphingobacteriales bacterium]